MILRQSVQALTRRRAPIARLPPALCQRRHRTRSETARSFILDPQEGDLLLSRRGDRSLPSELYAPNRLLRTLPLFVAVMVAAALAIFNYEKANSSVVSSCLYALRVHPVARDLLGDEIYFASSLPWIWGRIDTVHGRIDIRFRVKGTRDEAELKFVSVRDRRMGYFKTIEWALTMGDGRVVDLADEGEGAKDPLGKSRIKSQPS